MTFGGPLFRSALSHGNVCVIEPDVAGGPEPSFAGGQIAVVFVQLLDQEEGTSLTNAAGNLITFHGRRWLEGEGYALDQGRRRVRYFECYADAGTVDEVWIEEHTAAVRWRPFAPGTRALSDFERQIGCGLPRLPRLSGEHHGCELEAVQDEAHHQRATLHHLLAEGICPCHPDSSVHDP